MDPYSTYRFHLHFQKLTMADAKTILVGVSILYLWARAHELRNTCDLVIPTAALQRTSCSASPLQRF